jgi:glycosyltransferase involved in cell wall biosynthesis
MRVVQFQRLAPPGVFSMERQFDDVRAALPPEIAVTLRTNRYLSRGVFGRLADSVAARRHDGEINHVLGDVHYLAWFLPRHRTVLTVHDCVSLERMRGVRRGLFWLLWYWWPLQNAEYVTVVSDYTRESLLKWVRYPSARVRVISPPVSPEFKRTPAPPRGERLRLLQIGTTSNKNLPRVIDAIRGLPVTLVIVGRLDDSLRSRLRTLDVAYENYVDLDREELLRQYQQADALIFASTYEGFGMPIIEAQAVGRPVVTSNICSMPQACGQAACLVDPFDVSDIRRGIRRVIDDVEYCNELVRQGYVNAAAYTPERIAGQYAALYREIHDETR